MVDFYLKMKRCITNYVICITKHLGNAIHLVIGQLLVDSKLIGNLFFAGKHLLDIKHFALMKDLTDLTTVTVNPLLSLAS